MNEGIVRGYVPLSYRYIYIFLSFTRTLTVYSFLDSFWFVLLYISKIKNKKMNVKEWIEYDEQSVSFKQGGLNRCKAMHRNDFIAIQARRAYIIQYYMIEYRKEVQIRSLYFVFSSPEG